LIFSDSLHVKGGFPSEIPIMSAPRHVTHCAEDVSENKREDDKTKKRGQRILTGTVDFIAVPFVVRVYISDSTVRAD
jgi:hypothetical protein